MRVPGSEYSLHLVADDDDCLVKASKLWSLAACTVCATQDGGCLQCKSKREKTSENPNYADSVGNS